MQPTESRRLAELYLAHELPRRWRHVQRVGARAELLSHYVEEGTLLTTAAWLHDLGYAPDLAACQFHPLDGARALRSFGQNLRLCGLVAYHSAAAFEASALGIEDQLRVEFSDENSLTRDLLWYLDMTTSPDGEIVTFENRMDDVRKRYPAGHYVIRALDAGMNDRRAAVSRAELWLVETGLATHV